LEGLVVIDGGSTLSATENPWPRLAGLDVRATTDSLHLFTQVVGKIRLMMTPWINHSWHIPLYLSARGLTSGLITTNAQALEMEFDFLADRLVVGNSNGQDISIALTAQSVASFYAATIGALKTLGFDVTINPVPCELPECIAFPQDRAPRVYNGEVARAYWRALLQIQRVFQIFRSRFVGKCSPIHLFWGSFDLAVTRFSGRPAPQHPGGVPYLSDAVVREAYSHEVSSAGFWPGGGGVAAPAFYSYAYPAPPGFSGATIEPRQAYFDTTLGEFLLPYDAVQTSADPDGALLGFLQSTYEAAANLARWDRSALERASGPIGKPPASP
jgi:hypothetical protein